MKRNQQKKALKMPIPNNPFSPLLKWGAIAIDVLFLGGVVC